MLCALVLLECCKHLCVCVIFVLFYFFKCSHIAQNVSLLVPPLPPSLPPPPSTPTVSAVFAVCKMRVVPTLSGIAGTEFAFPFFLSFLFCANICPEFRDILQYRSLGVSVLLLFCLFLFFVLFICCFLAQGHLVYQSLVFVTMLASFRTSVSFYWLVG